MKRKINALIVAFTVLFMLNGCGLKGALYQTPEQPSEQETQASEPATAKAKG